MLHVVFDESSKREVPTNQLVSPGLSQLYWSSVLGIAIAHRTATTTHVYVSKTRWKDAMGGPERSAAGANKFAPRDASRGRVLLGIRRKVWG